jgi:O-antigen/teichoic acid export membrane protein
MLISHTLKYLPAQLLSPAAQLVSMILWTHWLSPADMGLFTLVTVAQEMAYVFCLGWFSVYALRYLPAETDLIGRRRYLGTENVVVLGSIAASLLAALVVVSTLPRDGSLLVHSLTVAGFFATRALNAHYAERARAQQGFVAYTLLQAVGPLGGLALGLIAFRHGQADAWVLLGCYAAAQALGTLLALPLLGTQLRLVRPDPALLRAAVAFGFPILGLGVLGWVAENYIRYLVQWQAGAATLGMMIVGWSLGRRCAAVASMLVATAAFPLASRLLNEGRREEALAQLSMNAALMLAVLLPVTAALALLGPALVSLTVAAQYRDIAAEMLSLAVVGGALRNLHAHVTDQLMVLDRRIRMAAEIDVIEIVACAAASFFGLMHYGLRGAVIGQALGSLLTLVVSMHWARKHLGLVWPWRESLKVLLATAAMFAVITALGTPPTLQGLLVGSLVGALTYALCMALAFWPQCRRLVRDWRAS